VPRADEGLGPACALDASGLCTVCSVRGGIAEDPGLAWNPGGGVAVTAATFTATAFGLGLGISTTRALVGTTSASCRKSHSERSIHRSTRSLPGMASLSTTKGSVSYPPGRARRRLDRLHRRGGPFPRLARSSRLRCLRRRRMLGLGRRLDCLLRFRLVHHCEKIVNGLTSAP
jgi:hypothetical protein